MPLPDLLDYSAGYPSPAAIKAAGFGGIVRYIGTPGRRKNLTPGEARVMLAAGIAIGLVHEDTAGWMRGGYAAGVRAARAALADAAGCGVQLRCLYLACDEDVTSQMPTVLACLDGAASVLGAARVGVYGEADVIDAALAGGHAHWGWQTRAWSGGRVSSRAHLLQQVGYVSVGGVQCDRNRVLQPDWGQWPTTATKVEDDMPAEDVWDHPLSVPAEATHLYAHSGYTAADWLRGANVRAVQNTQQVAALSTALSAVTKTLGALLADATKNPDLTSQAVQVAVAAALSTALADNLIHVQVTVGEAGKTPVTALPAPKAP